MKRVKDFSLIICLLILAVVVVFQCSPTNQIYKSWTNPDATKLSLKFNKVALFGIVLKTATRHLIEEELSKQIANSVAIPSYKVLSEDDMTNADNIKPKLSAQGFDGALIFRLVDVNSVESYSPGTYPNYYYTFTGYYGYSWGYMYDVGGQYRTNQIVTALINIYSIKDDKLIWSGETMSLNPTDIEKNIAAISKSVRDELVRDGLLERKEEK
jgi:hypothetical protein